MMTLHQALAMGNYGIYVWTTYGITFSVFSINLLLSFYEKNRVKKTIRTANYES